MAYNTIESGDVENETSSAGNTIPMILPNEAGTITGTNDSSSEGILSELNEMVGSETSSGNVDSAANPSSSHYEGGGRNDPTPTDDVGSSDDESLTNYVISSDLAELELPEDPEDS